MFTGDVQKVISSEVNKKRIPSRQEAELFWENYNSLEIFRKTQPTTTSIDMLYTPPPIPRWSTKPSGTSARMMRSWHIELLRFALLLFMTVSSDRKTAWGFRSTALPRMPALWHHRRLVYWSKHLLLASVPRGCILDILIQLHPRKEMIWTFKVALQWVKTLIRLCHYCRWTACGSQESFRIKAFPATYYSRALS